MSARLALFHLLKPQGGLSDHISHVSRLATGPTASCTHQKMFVRVALKPLDPVCSPVLVLVADLPRLWKFIPTRS